jgi:hypothetical protein
MRSFTLAKTSLSASLCSSASPRGSGRPSWRSRLSWRPTASAQSTSRRRTPVASANAEVTAAWTFSYTRGTLGRIVGRTCGRARATSSGSARNAIV